jgi:proline iminopeptidase
MAADGQEGKVAREGFDLHFRVYGHGAPLLILSGGPGFDCDYMEPVARELSSANAAILVELRGTGRSMPPKIDRETVNLKLYLADLEALRESLGFDKWTVLGHSAGAILALHYATAHPRRTAALILVDSGPVREALVPAMGDNISLHFTREENAAARNHPSFQTMLAGYFFDRDKAKAFIAGFRADSYHGDTGQMLAADLMGEGMDLRPVLQKLDVPALVVAGRQDPLDPGMQYELHLALKNSRLVLLDHCGHFAWLEQPEALYAAIRGFLGPVNSESPDPTRSAGSTKIAAKCQSSVPDAPPHPR